MSLLLSLFLFLAPPWATAPCESVAHAASPESNIVATANFRVEAPDAKKARQVADFAEQARRDIHDRWFGERDGKVPQWERLVTIQVHRDHPGYYATEITRDGVVTITLWAGDSHLESTTRHEVWHAVVHLRYRNKPIPRWIDEGIAVCNESAEEQKRTLMPLVRGDKQFRVRELAGFKEYPNDVLLFYAQGYSLTDFLVRTHGEAAVARFLEASFKHGQEEAFKRELGYSSFEDLEKQWREQLAKSLEPTSPRE